MPQDGALRETEGVQKLADHPRRQKLYTLDFSKPLKWNTPEDGVGEFYYLVEHPPLHSVVVHIGPKMAEWLITNTNNHNRPKVEQHAARLGREMGGDDYELTGDTVKFSKSAAMLDGQHRISGCAKSKAPLLTHVVFGLADEVFDVLDQGKKRTAGDVLAMCGVQDYTMVAGAVTWVLKVKEGRTLEGGATYGKITPRKIKELALGKMKGIADYTKDARLINLAYKHPPTMVAALLFMISERDPALARDFAHEWVHGAKVGRNKNFDVLNQRLLRIAHENAGTINRNVRAALVIQAFNYWNANIIASPRALTWKKGWTFPSLEFDKAKFLKAKEVADRENTSLSAVKHRVLQVLTKEMDQAQHAQLSLNEISERANIGRSSVQYVLSELVTGKQIRQVKPAAHNKPAVYRVLTPAAEIVG